MASLSRLAIRDNSKKISSFRLLTGDLTALNAAQKLQQWGDLKTALGGIILGRLAHESLYFFNTKLSNEPAASVEAQSERRWQIFYEGAQPTVAAGINNPYFRQPFNIEIGTANITDGRLLANSDEADLTHPSWVAFIAAFEAFASDPINLSVNFLKAVHVGSRR